MVEVKGLHLGAGSFLAPGEQGCNEAPRDRAQVLGFDLAAKPTALECIP